MNTVSYRMPQLQKFGTDMLRHVARICEEEKINYCLFFGSMLGAIRHHGPIPWDYDIDIAVLENDMDRFISEMESKLPEEYWVDFRSKYDSPKCFARIGVRGFDTFSLHIDVYRMIGYPDDVEKCKRIIKHGRLLLEMRLVKNANLDYYSGKKLKRIKLYRRILLPISTNFIVKRFDVLCKKYSYERMNKVGLIGTEGTYIYDRKIIDDTILVNYEDFQVRVPRTYDEILRGLYGDYMKYPKQERIDAALNHDYILHKLKMD